MPKRKVHDPNGPCPMEIDSIDVPTTEKSERKKPLAVKRRKKTIPKPLRMKVWAEYIGIEKGCAICMICNVNMISQMDFHCGHIQAEAEGGATCLANLRPICSKCNTSMGCMNMFEFKRVYFG
jgi:5-methylcytosine-specific restriction endonuclease McrA